MRYAVNVQRQNNHFLANFAEFIEVVEVPSQTFIEVDVQIGEEQYLNTEEVNFQYTEIYNVNILTETYKH